MEQKGTDFGHVMALAIHGTRRDQAALDSYVKHAKLNEEIGEFAEACMHKDYWVRKPAGEKVGTPLGEAGDSILMLLDILSDQYPDATPEQIVEQLEYEMMKGLLKWRSYMRFK